MSEIAEKALREKLGKKIIEINEPINCSFCGREGEKETAENINLNGHFSNSNKLTWIYPDERWICNSCLRRFANNIIK